MSFLFSVKLSSGSEVKMQNSGYGIRQISAIFGFFFNFPIYPLLVSMVQVRVL